MHIGNAVLIDALPPNQRLRGKQPEAKDTFWFSFCKVEWHRVGELLWGKRFESRKPFQAV